MRVAISLPVLHCLRGDAFVSSCLSILKIKTVIVAFTSSSRGI